MPEINHEPLKTINKSKKIISDIREILIKSVKTRLRSDVETAFLLSGGIDSSSLVSIASNFLGRKINTFSLVDTDDRYNEKKEIDFTVKDTSCKNHIIEINKKDFFQKIENNINYYHEPLPTISAYIHNELIKNIKKNYPKTKVLIEGNCADEIFAGYYDHYLQHLKICKDVKIKKFNENLHFWKKYIKKNIRNKYFQMHDIYIKNENFRDHIYDGYFELKKLFIKNNNYSFKEAFFTDDLLKNRMMNELFYEASPVILNSTDRNCMMYSIENRNPFLDTNLINYLYSLPSILFIQKGYNKYLLREAMKGLLNENIRTNRQKKGFNASINSLIDFKSNEFIDFFNEKSIVDDYVNKKKLNKILKMKKMPNYMSKFIFNYVNTKIFLKKFN